MLVRAHAGARAGQIIEMPYVAARAALAAGAVSEVSEEEVRAAGMAQPYPSRFHTDEPPDGYAIILNEDPRGGYVVVGPDGAILSEPPLPHMAAAREWARNHDRKTNVPIPPIPDPGDDPSWADPNDLAAMVAQSLPDTDTAAEAPRRGPGRPPKVKPMPEAAV